MTTPFQVSHHTGGVEHSRLPALRARTLRALLLAGRDRQTAQFEEHAARLAELTASPSEDVTGRDRAVVALRLYRVRETIEEIGHALARIDEDVDGTTRHPAPVHLEDRA
jgi:hypothetical protein